MTPVDRSALARVNALLDIKRYEEARQLLAPLIAQQPDNAELLLLMTRSLAGVKELTQARRTVEQACALVPDSAYAHRLRAEVLIEERPRLAREAATLSTILAPDDPQSWWVLTRAELVRKRTRKAWAAATRVAELAPASTLGHQARGLVLIHRRRWKQAEAEYRQGLAISPNHPGLLNNLGKAIAGQGRPKEASEFFVRAGQLDASTNLYSRNSALNARWSTGGRGWTWMSAKAARFGGVGVVLLIYALLGLVAISLASPFHRWAALALTILVTSVLVRRAALPEAAKQAIRAESMRRRAADRSDWRARRTFRWLIAAALVGAILNGLIRH